MRKRLLAHEVVPEHGTSRQYERGCRCRACTDAKLERNQKWRNANPDKAKGHKRRVTARRATRPIKVRRNEWLRWRYGITHDDRDRMLAQQGNCCAICKQPFLTDDAPAVDHDHKTGRVRGMLCDYCNRGLGWFKDDPERLRSAAEYLEVTCGE